MTSPLIVDTYAGDLDGKTDLSKLIAAGPPWHGWMGKATQGNYYSGGEWFRTHWPLAKSLAGDRYGHDWFRACYHYLDLRVDAKVQAEYFLSVVSRAGGWGSGDLWPVVDVERAGQRGGINAQLVIDRVSEWARIVTEHTGRSVILYAGSYLRELGIRDHMGCSLLWVARYGETLPLDSYASIGWSLDELFGWQYCGDGDGNLRGYPVVTPIGKVDISVLTIASGGDNALEYIRKNMAGG
jgi:GH25 family lysozyme M1 (1,4-beta-N-acetylmuramidase)